MLILGHCPVWSLAFCCGLKSCRIWWWASLVAQMVKNLPAVLETWVWSLDWEDPMEESMETHSSILAWRIPWTGEPGGLQSTGSQRVGHDWRLCTAKQRASWWTVLWVESQNSDPALCLLTESELFSKLFPGLWGMRTVLCEDSTRQCVAVSTEPRIIVTVTLHPKQLFVYLGTVLSDNSKASWIPWSWLAGSQRMTNFAPPFAGVHSVLLSRGHGRTFSPVLK